MATPALELVELLVRVNPGTTAASLKAFFRDGANTMLLVRSVTFLTEEASLMASVKNPWR